MTTPLCETCQGKGRETCALVGYKNRVLATFKATQEGLAVTPGPQGGNEGLIVKIQADTDADLASLPAEAARRGCTVFNA